MSSISNYGYQSVGTEEDTEFAAQTHDGPGEWDLPAVEINQVAMNVWGRKSGITSEAFIDEETVPLLKTKVSPLTTKG
jgi:hypothetical protein